MAATHSTTRPVNFSPASLSPASLGEALRPRVRALNARPVRDGAYVLCWLQQALRAQDNPVIDAAVAAGNQLGLPVLVYHGIREDYPYSSWRLHGFVLDASAELERGCAARGLACANLLVRPGKREKGLVYRLAEDAALVVSDLQPLFVGRWQLERFGARTQAPVWGVDANRLVPVSLLPEGLKSTKAFRAAHKALRDGAWARVDDAEPAVVPYSGPLPFVPDNPAGWSAAQRLARIRECRIDHTLPPGPWVRASRAEVEGLLGLLAERVLPRYKWSRNNPADAAGASHLSPHLHFGTVGPREVDAAVEGADAHAAAKWKYRDELLTWREWFHYLAHHRDSPTDYANVPEWARGTLDEHRDDGRERLYSLGELLHARTDDAVWNAGQRQFLLDGYMHNNLRMYWGKQILRWTASPEEAWSTACYLNDRLSYDGRDPATYGNMEWVFGGGRPGSREVPVYGKVAPKSDRALRGRKGVLDWVAAINARPLPEVSVPNRVPGYAHPATPLGPYFPIEASVDDTVTENGVRQAGAGAERQGPAATRAGADVG